MLGVGPLAPSKAPETNRTSAGPVPEKRVAVKVRQSPPPQFDHARFEITSPESCTDDLKVPWGPPYWTSRLRGRVVSHRAPGPLPTTHPSTTLVSLPPPPSSLWPSVAWNWPLVLSVRRS